MLAATYEEEAEAEEGHWWFIGRRRLFARLLEQVAPDRRTPMLDVGTSTGTNLRLLNDLGYRDVVGLDLSDAAIRYCFEKQLGTVRKGDACALPFADRSFGFVFATDIIEHVTDDHRALAEIHRVLRPGGSALITVPAFQALWGIQDEVSQHKRRYRMKGLLASVAAAGLAPVHSFYFNYLLFVPIFLARRALKLSGAKIDSEWSVNTKLVNRLCLRLFDMDIRSAPYLRPPFGVSALVIARRPAA
jgi:SAM-dependent methyltransferase